MMLSLAERSLVKSANHRHRLVSLSIRVALSTASPTPPPTSPMTQSKFYIPRSQRTTTTSMYEIDSIYDERLKRRRRIDPTRELNYTPDHWERHKNVYRRLRHIATTFGSSPFQRLLFPDFFVTSLIAGGLTYYNEFMSTAPLYIDGTGFAAATTAIALMTGFRLNASYGRYNEGRKLLSTVHSTSRDLAANSMMWIKLPQDKERMLKLIKAYSVALTYYLNQKGAHHSVRRCHSNFKEQIYAEYRAEMMDVFGDDKDEDYIRLCEWYSERRNVPLGITTLLRGIIAQNETKDAFTRELDIHVHRLVQSLGSCERIQKTPIPTCFTRHTSRLLFVWSNLMPFAIYPACGLFTLPTTIAVSFSIMGIEDIGVQLEEPFNILPLRQYSDNVNDSVDFVKLAYSVDEKRLL
eukprot:CCRYP_011422-RA/>CCRYP_011422-RA protein AED:0.00 eAED:0.00 QI:241/1/1/1/0.5/0.33/3/3869/407